MTSCLCEDEVLVNAYIIFYIKFGKNIIRSGTYVTISKETRSAIINGQIESFSCIKTSLKVALFSLEGLYLRLFAIIDTVIILVK